MAIRSHHFHSTFWFIPASERERASATERVLKRPLKMAPSRDSEESHNYFIKNRGCTNCCFLLVFVIFLAGWATLTFFGKHLNRFQIQIFLFRTSFRYWSKCIDLNTDLDTDLCAWMLLTYPFSLFRLQHLNMAIPSKCSCRPTVVEAFVEEELTSKFDSAASLSLVEFSCRVLRVILKFWNRKWQFDADNPGNAFDAIAKLVRCRSVAI